MISSAFKRGIHNEKVTVNPVKATRNARSGTVSYVGSMARGERRIREAIQARIDDAESIRDINVLTHQGDMCGNVAMFQWSS